MTSLVSIAMSCWAMPLVNVTSFVREVTTSVAGVGLDVVAHPGRDQGRQQDGNQRSCGETAAQGASHVGDAERDR